MRRGFRTLAGEHPTFIAFYAIFAIHAFIYQAFVRLQQCIGIGECATSLIKGAVWSAIWPAYWVGSFFLF